MRPVRRASCPSALSSTVLSWTSSAASTRCPRASPTAPAMPVAAASRTTAGGGTRRRAKTSTPTCASGRKRCSQSTSVPRLAFFDRAKAALDKRPLADGHARFDQLARGVGLVPHVPEQEPARLPVVVDIRDRSLPVRLLPRLDGRQARVDLADRLVAELEEIGVEERDVVVRLVGPGHVRADDLAVGVRVVLVLDAEALAERGAREVR